MKFKIPHIEVDTNEHCPCKDFNEYEIKIQCLKSKLHSRYLTIVAVIVCTWTIAVKVSDSEVFVGQLSLASTITSIILSVLAIILSISGEGKTEHIKDELEKTAKDISKSHKKVNDMNKCLEVNLDLLNKEVDKLHTEIDKLPEIIAKKVGDEIFQKTKKSENDIIINKTGDITDKASWGE